MKKLTKYYLSIGLLFICFVFNAQNQAKKWYFGNLAGLDFMTSPPTILTNGAMSTSEGCAAIADAAGNLLFYTDGSTIYNNSHVAMANGTGLLGFSSSSQSGIIVKQPGNNNIYFVFTQGATGNGTRYSIVDMTLASGQGSVTTKNTVLQNPSSEKLTSVRHCNGIDIWVMTHDNNNNTFRAYLVTSLGVNATAVVSNIGVSYIGADYIGILKFSPNGKKLAASLYSGSNLYEIYDFDNSTGSVSNPVNLGAGFTGAYGVEFSPDNTKLYGTRYASAFVYQWDLCAGSGPAIAASIYTVCGSVGQGKGALQLATDGKIYMARGTQTALGVIANPNVGGSGCNFTEIGQSIAPKMSLYGLPNFITSSLNPPPVPFTHTVSNSYGCQTASFTAPPTAQNFLTIGCSSSGYSLVGIAWNFGDPSSGSSNTTTVTNPSHAFSTLGTYTTQLIVYYSCGGGTDTIRQQVIINQPCISVSSTSITCANLGSATVAATGGVGPYSYTWMPTGQTSSVASGLNPGTYTLTVYDFGNNFTYTATTLFTSLVPFTGLLAYTPSLSCNGVNTATANIPLSGGSGNQNYYWTSSAGTQTTSGASGLGAGIHTITVIDALTSCSLTQFFQITQPPALTLNIATPSSSVCIGNSVTFTATASGGNPGPGSGYTYSWTAGPTTSVNTVSQVTSGTYTYVVNSRDASNCLITGTVPVVVIDNPQLYVSSSLICPFQTGTLTATGANSYTWSNNTNNTTLVDNPPATTVYTVTGETQGCLTSKTASIVLKPTPFAVINSNSPVCNNNALNLTGGGGTSYIWSGPAGFTSLIQNPQINPVALANSGVYNVTVTSANACTASAAANITILQAPVLSATGATACVLQTINLSANSVAGTTYTWTGSNSFVSNLANPSIASVPVSASGTYTVKVRSSQGCTNIAVANVSIIALPVPSFVSDGPKCQGNTINFNSNASTGGVSYAWTGPNGFTSSLPNPSLVNASANANGVYNLSVTAGPCVATISHPVTVYPLPSGVAVNSGPVCENQSFTLSVNNANVTYSWTGPSGFTANTQNVVFNYATVSHFGIYTVVIKDANNCSSSATTSVSVMPNPAIMAYGSSVCYGEPAVITASGAATYMWSGPNGFNATTAAATIPFVTNTVAETYTLLGQGLNGCKTVTTTVVIARVLPVATATVTNRACQNSVLFFNGDGGYVYEWLGPQDFMFGQKSFTVLAGNPGMSGTYTLNITDQTGCKGSTTASLMVDPAPTGKLVGTQLSGCVPFCSDFKLQVGSQTTITASNWQIGGQKYNGTIFNYCFTEAGNYFLKGSFVDSKSCNSDIDFVVKAYALPVADFDYFPLQVKENQDVLFTNTSLEANKRSRQWYFGENNADSHNSDFVNHTFTEPGIYPVILVLKNTNGCADTIIKLVNVEEDLDFFVPNAFTPDGDGLNDLFIPVGHGVKTYTMTIYNRWGEKLFDAVDPLLGWDGIFKGKACAPAIYTWKITARSLSGTEKYLSGTVLLNR